MYFTKIMIFIVFTSLSILSHVLANDSSLQNAAEMLMQQLESTPMDTVLFWNLVSLEACRNEFDRSVTSGADQGPPTFTSRAFAIIHGAMNDAVNLIHKNWKPIFQLSHIVVPNTVPEEPTTSAAVMEAAYQTLCGLYPKQKIMFDSIRDRYLKRLLDGNTASDMINMGVSIGQKVGSEIFAMRADDGSQTPGKHTPVGEAGFHKADPLHPKQVCLCPSWGDVKPFGIHSGIQFRSPNILGKSVCARQKYLKSKQYFDEYNEVKSYGGLNSTIRTEEQTEIGNFWAYDGAPKIGVPPRLYNQMIRVIAAIKRNSLAQNARLFALANFAMADSCIAGWETKYFYDFWRPIVAIREGTDAISADPDWTPLGAPSNGNGDNFTPNFPSFVSGHASFASATCEILRRFYETDTISFEMHSDEYNGKTKDSVTGQIRPVKTRFYKSFTEVEEENYMARIYLGIHWRIDQEFGKRLGREVATYIFKRFS